jgi:hypothetical protein
MRPARPPELYLLLALHLVLGLFACYGGIALIVHPDGSLLRMPLSFLDNAPFADYLIPGIILLLFNGVLPLLVFFSLVTHPTWDFADNLNIYGDKYWAWTYSLYTGIITIIWIIVQQLLTQYFILQPVVATIGLLIIIFTMLPRIKSYYQLPKKLR